jgi:serine-type D-Ala-D-Ala carboxypeptidase (penicillin-binding protein 5/6)
VSKRIKKNPQVLIKASRLPAPIAFIIAGLSLVTFILLGVVILKPSNAASGKVVPLTHYFLPVPTLTHTPIKTISIPVKKHNAPELSVTAKSVVVYDPNSAEILYAKNEQSRLPMASTTKIITAITALELFDLEEKVTITNANESIGQKSDLQPGEIWTVKELLYALMLSSGNDAAVTLAQHHPEGYGYFVAAMNRVAHRHNLTNTNFTNVSGIDQENHFTTALELARITQYALENPTLKEIVKTPHYTLANHNGTITRQLYNLNQLLTTVEGVDGVKTGTTPGAGECLVTSISRNNRRLIIVVLGSENRYMDTKSIINWAYTYHDWIDSAQVL